MQTKNLGATYLENNTIEFLVYAPNVSKLDLHLLDARDQLIPMQPKEQGYFFGVAEQTAPGCTYRFRINDQEFADPASKFQPQGVFGPSQVIAKQFAWTDQSWQGLSFNDFIIYECHVGTFTQEGTFKAIISKLKYLQDLGITALELMPIAQFSGARNWGYDGVFHFAPQNSYGTPEDLKELVNACHTLGLAVILDVVYNHFGPEGNIVAQFGPYFSTLHQTPWGAGINFDGPGSDGIRRFFIENALMWIRDYHIDALRLDAVHAIYDYSAYHFLAELADHIHHFEKETHRKIYLIAESALNDTRLVRPHENGGYALDAQWNDDFQHALHALLTGEQYGYYQDYGKIEQLTKAIREGFVLTGQYSRYWQCRHGGSSLAESPEKFVVFAQNHDHAGNRRHGERLTQLLSFEQLKLTAGVSLLSPFIPLLFMGEEYAETAPFLYFTDLSDSNLATAVWQGRTQEMLSLFGLGETPNPQAETSFLSSKLNEQLLQEKKHQAMLLFYQQLIELRKNHPALNKFSKDNYRVQSDQKRKILYLHRWCGEDEMLIAFNFSEQIQTMDKIPSGNWHKTFDSFFDIQKKESINQYVQPHSFLILTRKRRHN